MKKSILIILLIIMVLFIVPIIFTQRFNFYRASTNIIENETKDNIVNNYDYKEYKTVKLLHSKTNEIVEVKLDEYLYNVVSAEMPASFETEALKAQAVVARTYTIYKIINNNNKHGQADICDDSTCCQAWISKQDRLNKWEEQDREDCWLKISNAVDSTAGKIITYNGEVINAFFHANSGGVTEIPINVWGGSNYPYLQVVQTSGEDNYTQYSSEVILTKQQVVDKIKEKHNEIKINYDDEDAIKILEGTEGGRIRIIKFGNVNLSGVEARTIFGLKSANFTVLVQGENVKFEVIGYGHGVGMSQTGADAMAKQGNDYMQIIYHFYNGVEIKDL